MPAILLAAFFVLSQGVLGGLRQKLRVVQSSYSASFFVLFCPANIENNVHCYTGQCDAGNKASNIKPALRGKFHDEPDVVRTVRLFGTACLCVRTQMGGINEPAVRRAVHAYVFANARR